jgi:hypothetical protein
MSSIVVDSATREKLSNVFNTVELRDESGTILGYFSPKIDPTQWEPLEPQISEEELERRRNSKEKRYTTAEVLAHLEKL